MTVQTDLDAANSKLATDLVALDSAQALVTADQVEVARLLAELEALPTDLVGKTEAELVAIWHAIQKYFNGTVPDA